MARYRIVLLPLLVCAALLLTGALGHQTPRFARPPEFDPPAGPADAGAARLLEGAMQAFGPEQAGWLEMRLWQQVRDDDGWYELEGRFLSAPGNRLRLDLGVQAGPVRGRLEILCDGEHYWQVQRL